MCNLPPQAMGSYVDGLEAFSLKPAIFAHGFESSVPGLVFYVPFQISYSCTLDATTDR